MWDFPCRDLRISGLEVGSSSAVEDRAFSTFVAVASLSFGHWGSGTYGELGPQGEGILVEAWYCRNEESACSPVGRMGSSCRQVLDLASASPEDP